MSDELKQQIEAAEKVVEQAQERLSEANAELRALQLELIKRERGVEVGCVVRTVRSLKESLYLVTEVNPGSWSTRLKGRKQRKNGEFSSREVDVFGKWEVVEPAVESRP